MLGRGIVDDRVMRPRHLPVNRELRVQPRLGLSARHAARFDHPPDLSLGRGADADYYIIIRLPFALKKKRNYRNRKIVRRGGGKPRIDALADEWMDACLKHTACISIGEYDLCEPPTLIRRYQLMDDVVRI